MRSLISPPHRNVGTYNTTKINQLMAWNLYKAHWGLNHCQMGCVFPKSGWTCLKKMEKSPKKTLKTSIPKIDLQCFFYRISVSQVIQSDLLIPDRWRSPTTFERVTFSPSQKGHKELPGIFFFKNTSHCLVWFSWTSKIKHVIWVDVFVSHRFSFTSWRQETNLWVRHTTAIASTFRKWKTGSFSHHPWKERLKWSEPNLQDLLCCSR